MLNVSVKSESESSERERLSEKYLVYIGTAGIRKDVTDGLCYNSLRVHNFILSRNLQEGKASASRCKFCIWICICINLYLSLYLNLYLYPKTNRPGERQEGYQLGRPDPQVEKQVQPPQSAPWTLPGEDFIEKGVLPQNYCQNNISQSWYMTSLSSSVTNSSSRLVFVKMRAFS